MPDSPIISAALSAPAPLAGSAKVRLTPRNSPEIKAENKKQPAEPAPLAPAQTSANYIFQQKLAQCLQRLKKINELQADYEHVSAKTHLFFKNSKDYAKLHNSFITLNKNFRGEALNGIAMRNAEQKEWANVTFSAERMRDLTLWDDKINQSLLTMEKYNTKITTLYAPLQEILRRPPKKKDKASLTKAIQASRKSAKITLVDGSAEPVPLSPAPSPISSNAPEAAPLRLRAMSEMQVRATDDDENKVVLVRRHSEDKGEKMTTIKPFSSLNPFAVEFVPAFLAVSNDQRTLPVADSTSTATTPSPANSPSPSGSPSPRSTSVSLSTSLSQLFSAESSPVFYPDFIHEVKLHRASTEDNVIFNAQLHQPLEFSLFSPLTYSLQQDENPPHDEVAITEFDLDEVPPPVKSALATSQELSLTIEMTAAASGFAASAAPVAETDDSDIDALLLIPDMQQIESPTLAPQAVDASLIIWNLFSKKSIFQPLAVERDKVNAHELSGPAAGQW